MEEAALEPGAPSASPGPGPSHTPQGGPGGEERGEGAAYRKGCPGGWATHLPTTISSCSVAFRRKRCHTSMANRVLLLLKMEVSELMRAAMITAIIRPRRPGGRQGLRGHLALEALPGAVGSGVEMAWGRCWLRFPRAQVRNPGLDPGFRPRPASACSVALGEPSALPEPPQQGGVDKVISGVLCSPGISSGFQGLQTLVSGHWWGGR